jgi:hypothetical protein
MNEFIPSEQFVAKTMETIIAYEAGKARSGRMVIPGIVATFLQMGALLASCGIALANILRLYYTVFAPVVSH